MPNKELSSQLILLLQLLRLIFNPINIIIITNIKIINANKYKVQDISNYHYMLLLDMIINI